MAKASRGGRTPKKTPKNQKFDVEIELSTGTSSPGMYSCSLKVTRVKPFKAPKRRK